MAPNIKQMNMARKFFASLQAEADRDGAHYAPCFRDCLGDNQEWVTEAIGKLIARAMKLGHDKQAQTRPEQEKS